MKRAQCKELTHLVDSTSIDFTSVSRSINKRGIDWDKDGLSIAYNWSLPQDQTIVDTSYVTVKLNEAYVNNSVRYSGHATWELLHGLTEFYLDIDKSIHHYADMEVALAGPWSDTFSWTPEALSYAVLEIPGIISLGPAASITVGAKVSAVGEVGLSGQFTSQMPNGTIHIDFVNWDQSCSFPAPHSPLHLFLGTNK